MAFLYFVILTLPVLFFVEVSQAYPSCDAIFGRPRLSDCRAIENQIPSGTYKYIFAADRATIENERGSLTQDLPQFWSHGNCRMLLVNDNPSYPQDTSSWGSIAVAANVIDAQCVNPEWGSGTGGWEDVGTRNNLRLYVFAAQSDFARRIVEIWQASLCANTAHRNAIACSAAALYAQGAPLSNIDDAPPSNGAGTPSNGQKQQQKQSAGYCKEDMDCGFGFRCMDQPVKQPVTMFGVPVLSAISVCVYALGL
ncbi:MAG: hypothetical protein M1827_002222 [Pycnora praestabilis]|nr:MAG: hypothetical protein M1827_002222 [Pycnora praestabilis]